MKDTVRLGVVGAGNIAAKHLEALEGLAGASVVGIASRTRAKAAALAARFRIPCVADDLDGLLREARPDGLLILVSAANIAEVTRQAMRTGLPLFVEKPAGLTPAESAELARLAGELGVRSMVGYNRRYYSVFHQGIEVIRRHGPLLGLLIEGHERIDAVRAAGRQPDAVLHGWIYANATHTIDLLRFFGGEVDEMHCLAHRRREPLGDQFAAIMNFDSGALGEYSAHWLSPGGWRVMLSGQGVTVEFKPLEAGVWIDAKGQRHEIAPSEADQRYKPGFHGQMAAFCRLVRGEDPGWPAQDLAGAHRTMQLAARMTAAVADRPEGVGK
ncbi:MAG: scyllo-inositol 2-dehydrogenase (NAD(+)) [Bacteroidia bacterium]|nr:Gfo/Idh/MocA family oxidoreductase [Zoogloeaceae bacterium]MCG3168360.1 scyllo-inositol 2-dehydrogenase (NAD(+)) [Bacteroidia bacterium]MCK6383205.1 Gfo/Idh/MocA family oxidoreductase [Rhodocyclaceae bacterium]